MEKIKVLHSELNGELGGIESFLYNVYKFIDKEKVEFDFLTTSSNPAYGENLKKMGAKIYQVPSHCNLVCYFMSVCKILKKGNYDIVHVHKNSAIDILILSVLKQFPKVKVIVHSHNTYPSVGGKFQWLHYLNRKFLYKCADCHLACSENAGKWMYGNGSYEVIKNGIDTEAFLYNAMDRSEIRQMLGIDEKTFVIGHIGRFTEQKNHSKLIEIFASLKQKYENSYLVLIGCGELENNIKEKVSNLGLSNCVIFSGVQNNVNKFLCAMDAFVFPSVWEGLGIVAIEAQASGLNTYLSKEVPKEVEVTDAVTWFDNRENAVDISNQIQIKRTEKDIRLARNTAVLNSGYDMTQSAKRLQKIYEKLKITNKSSDIVI